MVTVAGDIPRKLPDLFSICTMKGPLPYAVWSLDWPRRTLKLVYSMSANRDLTVRLTASYTKTTVVHEGLDRP